jgi:MurNAc alpha-1-phosphate uridylyltransferase
VQGKPIIEYHLEALQKIGIREVVINISYLGDQIKTHLKHGERFGVNIQYSEEPEALETGGGIFQALPLLGDEPFILINADIFTQYPLVSLAHAPLKDSLVHVVLVPNPLEHLEGDFILKGDTWTYSGMAKVSPRLFDRCTPGKYSLIPLYLKAMEKQQITGEVYTGEWVDIGSLERYREVS